MLGGFFPGWQSARKLSEAVAPPEQSGNGDAEECPAGTTAGLVWVEEREGIGRDVVTGLEAALVELPALMFEAALFRRHLAELRRKHDVKLTVSLSSQGEFDQGEKRISAPEEMEASRKAAVEGVEADAKAENRERGPSESVQEVRFSARLLEAGETVLALEGNSRPSGEEEKGKHC